MKNKSLLGNFISSYSRTQKAEEKKHLIEIKKYQKEQEKIQIAKEVEADHQSKLASGFKLVSISSLNKYTKGAIIDQDLFVAVENARIRGERKMYIQEKILNGLEKKLQDYLISEKIMAKCTKLNNKGIEYEKVGNIDMAIKIYESNILEGCYPACHSFDRLMILYHKSKDYDNEIRVINRTLEVICKRYPNLTTKYEDRKNKLITTLNHKK